MTKLKRPKKNQLVLPDGKIKTSRSRVDLHQALKLKVENGLSYQEIADYFGVKKQSIHSLLRPYIPDSANVKVFRDHKADILSAQQMRVLGAMTDADLKKASAKDKALIFGILHDKEQDMKGSGNRFVAMFFQLQAKACEVQQVIDITHSQGSAE